MVETEGDRAESWNEWGRKFERDDGTTINASWDPVGFPLPPGPDPGGHPPATGLDGDNRGWSLMVCLERREFRRLIAD